MTTPFELMRFSQTDTDTEIYFTFYEHRHPIFLGPTSRLYFFSTWADYTPSPHGISFFLLLGRTYSQAHKSFSFGPKLTTSPYDLL